MSQGNSQGDHQEPTLPPLAFTRPATESVEEMRVEEARSVPNLGQSIQAARAAKDMTAADLAQALNLDLRIVEAIEANRFEDAPDPVYIRAYLKHWARLLDVDPAQWISAYNAQSSIECGQDVRIIGTRPPLEVMTPHKANRNVHGNKSGGRIWRGMGTLIVVVLVVAVLILAMPAAWQQWVSARLGGHNATEMGSDRPIALMPPRDGGAKTSINVPLTPPEPSSAPASAAPSPNAPTAASSSVLQALPPPPMGQAETSPAADNAPSVEQPAATEPASTDTPESASSSSSTTPAPTSDAQVAGDLVIKATDADCWVEVRNADGKRLVYDVLKQGETRQVAGKGPFTVVLGNPAAVEVLWKGQPVKLDAPYANNCVVRTTVGG
jgi:cytoskeleton protein RodZ